MHKKSRHIFFLFSLFGFCVVDAQQSAPVTDTLVTVSELPPAEENDTAVFSLVGQPAAVPVRNLPKKRVDSLKAEEDFWYANAEFKKEKLQTENKAPRGLGFLQQRWFRDLLWIIILCSFLAVVLWYLASSNVLLFRRKAKTIASGDDHPEATDDIFSLNYEKEIARAEQTGNLRLAVRLHYLQLLRLLSEQNLIDYRIGRTNQDYVVQLFQSKYYQHFFRLTRNFEYTWYGQFEPAAETYSLLKQDFSTFKNGLRR